MEKRYVIGVVAFLFAVAMTVPVLSDEQKGSGDFLIDALLGAGEGAIVGEASGGKAGKGALIGLGTGLAREAIVKPMLKGGLQGTGPTAGTVPQGQVTQPMDPYSRGYQEGFREGYNQGYQAALDGVRK